MGMQRTTGKIRKRNAAGLASKSCSDKSEFTWNLVSLIPIRVCAANRSGLSSKGKEGKFPALLWIFRAPNCRDYTLLSRASVVSRELFCLWQRTIWVNCSATRMGGKIFPECLTKGRFKNTNFAPLSAVTIHNINYTYHSAKWSDRVMLNYYTYSVMAFCITFEI